MSKIRGINLFQENEFFQDALRSNQRRLLKVSRDRAFLLDRLLQYEQPENSSTESDETEESSDDDLPKDRKRYLLLILCIKHFTKKHFFVKFN